MNLISIAIGLSLGVFLFHSYRRGRLLRAELQLANNKIEEALARAERAGRLKTDFLSKMSHELRTPINGILGMASLLRKTLGGEQQVYYVDKIAISANLLLSQFNEILELSKVEAGKVQIESVVFDLEEFVTDIFASFKPIAEQRGLSFESVLINNATRRFQGDPNRIRQILNNLIANALKFTPEGQVKLEVVASGISNKGVSRIMFTVIDDGIGIPEAERNSLFSRSNSAYPRTRGPFGLGLALSKQLADLMGGSINVEGRNGKGTVFHFSVEVPIASQLELEDQTKLKTQNLIGGPARLLLVEDNDINQEITRTMLEHKGYRVDHADNGLAAVDACRLNNYAMVLMDCQMPLMDGYEATEKIRTFDKGLPIIALTAHAFSKDRERCKEAGMTDYLAKPFTEESLTQMVKKYTANPEANIDEAPPASFDLSYIEKLEELDIHGKHNLVPQLIQRFLLAAKEFKTKMVLSEQNSDFENLKKEAHKLKSSAGHLGLTRLSGLLGKIEYQEDLECSSEPLFIETTSALDESCEHLSNYLNKSGRGPKAFEEASNIKLDSKAF